MNIVKNISLYSSRVTYLIDHKVELTETEPVKHKPYPIPYKMQEIIDKEIDEMFRMGVIEHHLRITTGLS